MLKNSQFLKKIQILGLISEACKNSCQNFFTPPEVHSTHLKTLNLSTLPALLLILLFWSVLPSVSVPTGRGAPGRP